MQKNWKIEIDLDPFQCWVNCTVSCSLMLCYFCPTPTLPSISCELKLSQQLKQWSSKCDKNNFRLLNILIVVWNCICSAVTVPWGWRWTAVDENTLRSLSCTEMSRFMQNWRDAQQHTDAYLFLNAAMHVNRQTQDYYTHTYVQALLQTWKDHTQSQRSPHYWVLNVCQIV